MKYAELDNLEIVEIHEELPRAWRNISGLCNYPDDELADLGWSGNGGCAFYPVVEGSQPSYDPKTQTISYQDTVDANAKVVNRTWSAVLYSQDQIDAEWARVRSRRNSHLKACDFTQLADAPLTAEKKTEWLSYRQALRNLPQNTVNPFDVTWPTQPNP
jgi:hypothetical protein